jgi:hypothetical protein
MIEPRRTSELPSEVVKMATRKPGEGAGSQGLRCQIFGCNAARAH